MCTTGFFKTNSTTREESYEYLAISTFVNVEDQETMDD